MNEWGGKAKNKASEDVMKHNEGCWRNLKQSKMTGAKGKEHYLSNLRGVERIKKSLKGKGGQNEGLL